MLGANYAFVTSGGFQFWDSLTAAIYTNPELATFEEMKIIIEQDKDSRLGYTYPSEGGHPVRVAFHAKAMQFEALFLAVLNGDF
jgi:inosine-uridine nucleoside N-ribohydrolase